MNQVAHAPVHLHNAQFEPVLLSPALTAIGQQEGAKGQVATRKGSCRGGGARVAAGGAIDKGGCSKGKDPEGAVPLRGGPVTALVLGRAGQGYPRIALQDVLHGCVHCMGMYADC